MNERKIPFSNKCEISHTFIHNTNGTPGFLQIDSINSVNNKGDRGHPCLQPLRSEKPKESFSIAYIVKKKSK